MVIQMFHTYHAKHLLCLARELNILFWDSSSTEEFIRVCVCVCVCVCVRERESTHHCIHTRVHIMYRILEEGLSGRWSHSFACWLTCLLRVVCLCLMECVCSYAVSFLWSSMLMDDDKKKQSSMYFSSPWKIPSTFYGTWLYFFPQYSKNI